MAKPSTICSKIWTGGQLLPIQPQQRRFIGCSLWTRARLSFALGLLMSGCASTEPIPNAGPESAIGSFRVSRYTDAPLQDRQEREVPAPCQAIFKAILLDPRSTMDAAHLRWEISPFGSQRRDNLPPPRSVRTYHVGSSRITEKIVHWKSDRLLAFSFLRERSSIDWPFEDHLAVIHLKPRPSGCHVLWLNHFKLPFAFSSLHAKRRLTKVLIPKAFNRIGRSFSHSPSSSAPGIQKRSFSLPSQ